jgi:hypothetical protein
MHEIGRSKEEAVPVGRMLHHGVIKQRRWK